MWHSTATSFLSFWEHWKSILIIPIAVAFGNFAEKEYMHIAPQLTSYLNKFEAHVYTHYVWYYGCNDRLYINLPMLRLHFDWPSSSHIWHTCGRRQHCGSHHNEETARHKTIDNQNCTKLCSPSHSHALEIWKLSIVRVLRRDQVSKVMLVQIFVVLNNCLFTRYINWQNYFNGNH